MAYVQSPVAIGTLKSVDFSRALELPGVIGAIDWRDVPGPLMITHHLDVPIFVKDTASWIPLSQKNVFSFLISFNLLGGIEEEQHYKLKVSRKKIGGDGKEEDALAGNDAPKPTKLDLSSVSLYFSPLLIFADFLLRAAGGRNLCRRP